MKIIPRHWAKRHFSFFVVVVVLAMMNSCIEKRYNHRGDEECFCYRALRLVFCGINHYQITSPHSSPELRIIT